MAFTLTLFSNDAAFVKLFSEIVSATFGDQWTLGAGTPGQVPSGHEPCIWDFVPGETTLPRYLESTQLCRHWFVLHRRHLKELYRLMETSDLNVLLKPVSRAMIQAFLADITQRMVKFGSGTRIEGTRVDAGQVVQYLIQANLKLQEYDQDKNNFLSRSVYEFQAPLTAISGYCGLLLEEDLGPLTEEQRSVLGRMLNCATRLSRVSSAMFQLSVPRGVEPALKMDARDIRGCIEQALQELTLRLQDKRISVTVDIEPAPGGLLFAGSQMEQAFFNLLENACRFTPRGGTIVVKGYSYFWERRGEPALPLNGTLDRRVRQIQHSNSFRIDISDSGPGIPGPNLKKIFEEHTSHSGGEDRSGAGLGLAICRMILQQHHGCIWADSTPECAVFSLVIPLQHIDDDPTWNSKGTADIEIGAVIN